LEKGLKTRTQPKQKEPVFEFLNRTTVMLSVLLTPETQQQLSLHVKHLAAMNLSISDALLAESKNPTTLATNKPLDDDAQKDAVGTSLSLTQVNSYLNEEDLPSALREGLLQDLLISFEKRFNKSIRRKSDKTPAKLSWQKKLLIALGLGAGVLNTICDSFGSMSVLLSTVITDATLGLGLLWASLGFALLCVGLSLLYQICMLAKSEKVSWMKVPQTLAHYTKERQMLNELVTFMDSGRFLTALQNGELTADELDSLKAMIKSRDNCLRNKSTFLDQSRRAGVPTFLRGLAVGGLGLWLLVCGFMFGFFALSMIPMLIPTVILPLWGFILFGVLTGAAALTTFLVFMREDVSGAVDRLIGLDETLIAELAVGAQEVNLDEINIPKKQIDFSAHRFVVPDLDVPDLDVPTPFYSGPFAIVPSALSTVHNTDFNLTRS
jgi:hypothetical protein